jgi:hypothetical protein
MNGCFGQRAFTTMYIKLLKTATNMKATRPLLSLCLVIGMTIISYVTFSFALAKRVSSIFSKLPSSIYYLKNSVSGIRYLSISNAITSLFIGNGSMFYNAYRKRLTS